MWLTVTAIIAGLAVLAWSAHRFIEGCAALARHFHVHPLVIGVTIIGFGTSAPELLVSGLAAWDGAPGLGIGNAIGSCIANVGMIGGITALMVPFTVSSSVLQRELPLLLGVTLLAIALLADNHFGRMDALVLLLSALAAVAWSVRNAHRGAPGDPLVDAEEQTGSGLGVRRAGIDTAVGLVLLLASSRALVWGAVQLAQQFAISDVIIGLTIVAIGTSLPELAAAIVASVRRQPDLVIGNVIGSNILNLSAVLALPGLIAPGPLDAGMVPRDLIALAVLTLMLLAAVWGFHGTPRIRRWEGILLLGAFCGYQILLYFATI